MLTTTPEQDPRLHPPLSQRIGNPDMPALALGLCALLGAGVSITTATAIAGSLLLSLVITALLLGITRSLVGGDLQNALVIVLFAGVASALDLMSAIAWPRLHAPVASWLPLLAAAGVLLPQTGLMPVGQSFSRSIRNAVYTGAAMLALAICTGSLYSLLGGATAWPIGLLLLGLLIATWNAISARRALP